MKTSQILTSFVLLIIIIVGVVVIVRHKPADTIPSQTPTPSEEPASLPQAYENGSEGFSIRLPDGYTPAEYINEISTAQKIHGIKFSIPKSVYDGTNLSQDSYISVESIPGNKTCTADMFLDRTANGVASSTDGDITYSVASSSDAAAGNRYEQTVYALPWTHPCLAIRYFLHWGVFENYPAGTKKEFDKAAILSTFDSIRKTLIINQ